MNGQQDLIKYVDELYSIAVKKTGNSYVAEDIVQETFLAALKAMSRGKHPDDLHAWLIRVLSNKYCDWLREKYNKPYVSFEDYPSDIPDEEETYDDADEKLEKIRRELGYLGKLHREVMIRFYMHGEPLEQIAQELGLPVGTVKSRLYTGREHIKKGVNRMGNYVKQSYEPDRLVVGYSGSGGLNGVPFALVSDKLTQNILIIAYPKPVAETEIAKALGVPVAYIEPIVEKLLDGELMRRTDGGKVYTDFIIYTREDRYATFEKQLDTVEKNFDRFWGEIEKALSELRSKEYYSSQPVEARSKLELHLCIKLLLNARVTVRSEVTGEMPYSEYPYRKDGGQWIASGIHYASGDDRKKDDAAKKYVVNGEAGYTTHTFLDAKRLKLYCYDTYLGSATHYSYLKQEEHVCWLYELYTGVPYEKTSVNGFVLQDTEELIKNGIIKRDGTLKLIIPVLTAEEEQDYRTLIGNHVDRLASDIREAWLPVFDDGYVKLPPHLTSVPKWKQYAYCENAVPMAVINKAIEKGLFLDKVDYPLPAYILVVEKA